MARETTSNTASGEANETRVYDLGYHVVPTVSEDEMAAEAARLKRLIEGAGGAVIAEGFPTRVELSYSMERTFGNERRSFDSAYLGWFAFTGTAETAEELKSAFDADEHILRYLLVVTSEEEVAAAQAAAEKRAADLAASARTDGEPASRDTDSDEALDRSIEAVTTA